MPYTTNGIWYPDSIATSRLWELFQDQAESVDAALASRDAAMAAGAPAWLYRRSTNQTGVAAGVNTIVTGMSLVTVDSSPDPADYFTYSSGVFTTVTAGRYRLRGVATWVTGTIPTLLATLKVDSVDMDTHWAQQSSAHATKTRVEADPVYLGVGDMWQLEVGHAGGAATTSLSGSATEHRIGMAITYLGA